MRNQCLNAPQVHPPARNLADVGWVAPRTHLAEVTESGVAGCACPGGELTGRRMSSVREAMVKVLRRSHGDGAGAQLDTDPVERSTVNAGTLPWVPLAPGSRFGACGKVRRRLMPAAGGGELVVVGGRESRSQGEGAQFDCAATDASGHQPIQSLSSHNHGSKRRGQTNWTTKRVPLSAVSPRRPLLRLVGTDRMASGYRTNTMGERP